jgi:hypothetical protein
MYLQSYEALCRSFFVVVELKAALNVVFSAAKEGRLQDSGTIHICANFAKYIARARCMMSCQKVAEKSPASFPA